MQKILFAICVTMIFASFSSAEDLSNAEDRHASMLDTHREFLQTHCFDCRPTAPAL